MSTSKNHSPFIADQCLYVLNPKNGQRISLKECLRLSNLPEFDAIDQSMKNDNHKNRTTDLWQPIRSASQRVRFLTTLEIPGQSSVRTASDQVAIKNRSQENHSQRKLLCITSSAGIGKTMAVEQTKFLHTNRSNHWVIHYHFEKLPTHPDGFWGIGHLDASSEPIYERLEKLRMGTHKTGSSPVWKEAVNLFLKTKMDAGQVTIIVDGLDEHDPKSGATKALALRKFLVQNPRLHCVVAGRPYAIAETYWNALFKLTEDGRDDDMSEWAFCCVGMFSQNQIRRSLGPKRAEQILSLAGELNLTPRTIEVLRTLSDESFGRIKNLCDVYWESLQRTLLEDVLKKKKGIINPYVAGIPPDTYVEYACALAITMFLANKREVQYSEIADDLLTKLQTIPRWRSESSKQLDERRDSIAKLNTGAIEFRFYQQFDSSVESVEWRDKTLRDFFAALWMVRYSSDDEVNQLIERIPERPKVPDDNEVWEFISSMPAGAMMVGPPRKRYGRWLGLADAVFQPPEINPRPTQLMWYAWPRLSELMTAASEYNIPPLVAEGAKSIQERFFDEFKLLPESPGSAQIIHEDLIFVPIKPLDNGSWKVTVGHPWEVDNQPRPKILDGPYSVSKYPITRRLYKLFDRNLEGKYRIDYETHSMDNRCPVFCVNWYDAKMFSIWCKSRLLTEWEWEYACRGNQRAEEHAKLEHWRTDNDRELEEVAWFAKNSEGKFHPVGGRDENEFGIQDMLGNVYEWTESIYRAGEVSRVLRGGSFVFNGRNASASVRIHSDPTYTVISHGFRVARALDRKS